jgi:hypothetical protein
MLRQHRAKDGNGVARLTTPVGDSMTCPCESGLAPRACCRQSGGGWYKAPEPFEPASPLTGFSHPKCYLRDTHNCCEILENEHYVSAVVLRTIGPLLRVSGPTWVKGGISRDIPVEQFTSRVLCARHNRALGSIDAQGGRFVQWMRDFCNTSITPRLSRVLLSGHDVERWCLKTFLGLMAAGILRSDPGQVIHRVNVHSEVVDLSFGRIADEWGRGLWVRSDPQRVVNIEYAISMGPVLDLATNRIFGLTFNFFGVDFVFAIAPFSVANAVFRPSQFIVRRPGGICTIEFSWAPGVPHSGPVRYDWLGRGTPKATSPSV